MRYVALDGTNDVCTGVLVNEACALNFPEAIFELIDVDATYTVRVKLREPFHLLHKVVLFGDEADQNRELHGVKGAGA